jgi:hypothetical protein
VAIDGNAVLIHGEPFLNFYFPVIPFLGNIQSHRMYHSPLLMSITRRSSLPTGMTNLSDEYANPADFCANLHHHVFAFLKIVLDIRA